MPTFSQARIAPETTGGWACWQRGLRLSLGAPAALFVPAVLAQYAALLPDMATALAPQATAGLLAWLVVHLAALLLEAACYAALIVRIDRLFAGESARAAGAVRTGWRRAVALMVAGIIYNVVVGAGLILFILPGLFFSVALLFFAFPIVLDGAGPIAGLGASYDCTSKRFWRTSAAISVAFLVYSFYVMLTWTPAFIGVDWRSLAALIAAGQQGALTLPELTARASGLVTPAPVAAPLWYFGLNPLLGGAVMPPVLATLYIAYRRTAAN